MNTYQTLELINGNTIKLTLNLKRLLILKTNHRDLYREVSGIIMKGSDDMLDMVKILYASYLCALETGVEEMSYDTFLDVVPQDFGTISSIAGDLISPKKK